MRILIVVLLAACFSPGLLAQQAVDPEAIRKEMEKLAAARERAQDRRRQEVLRQVTEAAATPVSAGRFYEQAVRATRFTGRRAQLQDFAEWRKQNDWLGSSEFRAAAQLHLAYLVLTLRRAASDEPEVFVRPSRDYLEDYRQIQSRQFSRQDRAPREQRELLNSAVDGSVISEWLQIAPLIADIEDWEIVPGNFRGILEKNIRKHLREQADPALLQTWDYQIAIETENASDERLEYEREQFDYVRLPQLHFAKARDMLALGETQGALRNILRLMANYPEHGDFDQWAAAVESALAEMEPETVEVEETTPAPPDEED